MAVSWLISVPSLDNHVHNVFETFVSSWFASSDTNSKVRGI